MERGRKTKVITIIALVVTIVTMSLGFAVFSNVLTISSSATVKPNAEDYIVTIYGTAEEMPEDIVATEVDRIVPYMTSKTTSIPALGTTFDATPAIIDNKTFSISNINFIISASGQSSTYAFLIKNEGKKSVYMNLPADSNVDKMCVAAEGTTQTLVDQDCEKFSIGYVIISSEGNMIQLTENFYEITSNDFVLLFVYGGHLYTSALVSDGDFTVTFDNIEFEFSSVNNSQNS